MIFPAESRENGLADRFLPQGRVRLPETTTIPGCGFERGNNVPDEEPLRALNNFGASKKKAHYLKTIAGSQVS